IKSPTNIDSNESCWYCTHYLSGVNIVSGNSGNLQFKFTYSDSNPSALITAYDFAIGTDPDVNNALITINDIPVPSQAVGTEITLSSTISVKPNPSAMLNQIGYGEIYHWWIRPTNNAAQTSAWIEASTTFATPSHAFPLVRIVPKVAKLVLNQSTTVCTTIDNDGDVTDDPCYTTCWTPGTGAPDLEDLNNWKCSVCYDPTTNLPIYCSTDNTTPNAFTWSIIEGTGTLSALDAENPTLTYTAKSEELRTRLIITGSECGGEQGEGEGVGGTMPIPKWKEVAK
ncbi:MAG TPA: hypothetical protein PK476_03130, partial [Candidatus Pacearchaeota archaeon]|nr:hypothetical protein [Candidatus Pacearchaeota archaeon]